MALPARTLGLAGAACFGLAAGFLVFAPFGGTWDVVATPTTRSYSCSDGQGGTTTCVDRDVSRRDEYYFYSVLAGPGEATALVATALVLGGAAGLVWMGRPAWALAAAGVAGVSLVVITVVFTVDAVGSGDWWYDAGFYGGVSASLTGAVLVWSSRRAAGPQT